MVIRDEIIECRYYECNTRAGAKIYKGRLVIGTSSCDSPYIEEKFMYMTGKDVITLSEESQGESEFVTLEVVKEILGNLKKEFLEKLPPGEIIRERRIY